MEQSTVLTNILPQLNIGDISHSIINQTTHTETLAHLLFLPGQYLLIYKEGETTNYKFIAPAALREAFAAEPIDSGYLPPNTVRWGRCHKGEWLVQFYPPQRYCISLENTTLKVPMPGLIFAGCNRQYWIWAIKKFEQNSPLFYAPLPNVMENGSICFGENSVSNCSPENIVQVWQLFWHSAFNQDSVQGKSKSYPENVRSHLQQLHNNKSKRYPTRDLVPWGNKTITTAIEQIIS
jgi:PRTRC genetic system protein B